MSATPQENAAKCPNCDTPYSGEWCHACGQRRIRAEHRRMRWLAAQLVSGVTSLDSKFLRSLLALVLQPGRLGSEWLRGRRARWITPVGMFLVVNLVYFIAPPLTDFNLSLGTQLGDQPYSGWATSVVDAKVPGTEAWLASSRAASPPPGYEAFKRKFEQRSGSLSKTLLILHVPLAALALWLLHRRRKIFFVDHFAIALHHWSFILLAMMVVPRIVVVAGDLAHSLSWVEDPRALVPFFKMGLLALVVGHLALALRRAYDQPIHLAAAKAIPVMGACAFAHFLYRPLLFVLSAWTI